MNLSTATMRALASKYFISCAPVPLDAWRSELPDAFCRVNCKISRKSVRLGQSYRSYNIISTFLAKIPVKIEAYWFL